MSKTAEELRAEAARQREQLGDTVDAIGDRVSPSRIVERKANRMRDRVNSARESIMGVADHTMYAVHDGATASAGSAGAAATSVAGLPQATAERAITTTQGNPLIAGAVAFGAGLLVAMIFPGSKTEARAGQALATAAQPLVDQAKQIGQEVAGQLQEPAQEAIGHVKEAAASSVAAVEHSAKATVDATTSAGAEAAREVRERAASATDEVRGAASGDAPSEGTGATPTAGARRDPRIEPSDPHLEGSSSTVSDWFGQEAAADADLAEKLVGQAGGDDQLAQARFDQVSHHAEAERGEKENRSAG